MKYVVLLHDGELRLFVFPASIEHDDAAAAIRRYGEPVRAGFVRRAPSGLVCQEESQSLGLRADPQADSDLLRAQLDDPYYRFYL